MLEKPITFFYLWSGEFVTYTVIYNYFIMTIFCVYLISHIFYERVNIKLYTLLLYTHL